MYRSFAQECCEDTPLSVVFGFCKYVVTRIEELIKSIRGRTTLVAFRNLPVTFISYIIPQKDDSVGTIPSEVYVY